MTSSANGDAPLFSSSLLVKQAASPRDWATGLLTLSVIALALLLGWVLGFAGWQSSARRKKAETAEAASANSAAAESQNRSKALDQVRMAGPSHVPRASSVKSAPEKDAKGGLTIYQNGKIIFEQSAVDWKSPPAGSHHSGIFLSSESANARLLDRVEPVYPERAREQNVQGQVVLNAFVGKDGSVQELKLISGDSELALAAESPRHA